MNLLWIYMPHQGALVPHQRLTRVLWCLTSANMASVYTATGVALAPKRCRHRGLLLLHFSQRTERPCVQLLVPLRIQKNAADRVTWALLDAGRALLDAGRLSPMRLLPPLAPLYAALGVALASANSTGSATRLPLTPPGAALGFR